MGVFTRFLAVSSLLNLLLLLASIQGSIGALILLSVLSGSLVLLTLSAVLMALVRYCGILLRTR
jgi:hypothetical protein